MKFVFLLTALLPWLFYILFAGDAADVASSPESLEEVFLGEKPEKDSVPAVKKLKNVFAEGNVSRGPKNQINRTFPLRLLNLLSKRIIAGLQPKISP